MPRSRNASQPNDNEPIIRLKGVVKEYPGSGAATRALKGIDLDIRRGEFLGIFGTSGAGKTTLLNMITGVDRATEGEIWVAGTPVHRLNENALASWRGRTLGVVYQSFQLMPSLNLMANIALPMDFSGAFRPRESRERALELLREVELEAHARKLPATMSGGEQQRVAIARALANDPPILVADEPTGRLDTVTTETILKIFLKLIERGKTIVMVTHDTGLAESVSRVVRLVDGGIASDSSKDGGQ